MSRRIQVSGTRSNAWYAYVYDRTNVPVEIQRVCRLTGAEIPLVTNRTLGPQPTGAHAKP